MSTDALAGVADRLYGLLPADFTAERNAAARQAKGAGDRELSDQVKRLPKPSAAASVMNTLVRDRPDQFELVLQLGQALRSAQTELDASALKTLASERRALLASVAASALDTVRANGGTLGDAVLPEVEQTLQAVLADPAAAAAAASGRLLRALTSTGIDDVDLDDAVGGPPAEPLAPLRAVRPAKPPKAAPDSQQQARKRAAEALAAAEDTATKAERERRTADERAERAADRHSELADEVAALQKRLLELQGQLAGAEGDSDNAARSAEKARSAAETAEKARDRAAARLRELT